MKPEHNVEISEDTSQNKSKIFVSPGEKLAVIEEYLPGRGTYVEDGNIYSSITGHLSFNATKRELQIHPRTNQPLIPCEGDIVIGKVTGQQEKSLTLEISQLEDKQLSNPFTGVMYITDVSHSYVKTMNDAFKVGDIVRARIISTKNSEYHLSTQNDNLGVIQAFCIRCGAPLIRGRNRLSCPRCNKIGKRKVSKDYGKSYF